MKINYNNSIVNLPDFIIVGAQKSATTSIYKNLINNPNIYMPEIKEINFFAYDDNDIELDVYKKYNLGNHFKIVTNESTYFNLFNITDCKDMIIGESSVNYLYRYIHTINKIKKYYGENSRKLKIIICLRNPIDRAFSSWLMNIRDGLESMDFNKAIDLLLKNENLNRLETLNYLKFGLYYKSVLEYIENFDNVHILLYDDILHDFPSEINKIFEFLNVRIMSKKNIPNLRYNVSGIPRVKFLHHIMSSDFYFKKYLKQFLPKKYIIFIRNILNINYKKPKINNNAKDKLINYYKNDLRNLGPLIHRDLSSWTK